MKKLRAMLSEWGVPAGILAFWAVAAIYTVHALVGMQKAAMQYQKAPAELSAPRGA